MTTFVKLEFIEPTRPNIKAIVELTIDLTDGESAFNLFAQMFLRVYGKRFLFHDNQWYGLVRGKWKAIDIPFEVKLRDTLLKAFKEDYYELKFEYVKRQLVFENHNRRKELCQKEMKCMHILGLFDSLAFCKKLEKELRNIYIE